MKRKGQVWISAVLYVLIISVVIVLVLQAGLPLLGKMRDRSAYERSKDSMTGLDQTIKQVAGEGQGSQRVVPLEVRKGTVIIDDSINWQLKTESQLIEPRASIEEGSLKVSSNTNVYCYTNDAGEYVMNNTHIVVVVANYNETVPGSGAENIVNSISQIDDNGLVTPIVNPTELDISLDASGFSHDKIITEMLCSEHKAHGKGIVQAKIVNAAGDHSYTVNVILESDADFIALKVVDVEGV